MFMTICVLVPLNSPEAFLTNYIFIHAIIAPPPPSKLFLNSRNF